MLTYNRPFPVGEALALQVKRKEALALQVKRKEALALPKVNCQNKGFYHEFSRQSFSR